MGKVNSIQSRFEFHRRLKHAIQEVRDLILFQIKILAIWFEVNENKWGKYQIIIVIASFSIRKYSRIFHGFNSFNSFIVPLVKDHSGDVCNVDNYRGITISDGQYLTK